MHIATAERRPKKRKGGPLEVALVSVKASVALGQKYVIFLSDGISSIGTIARYNAAVAELKALNVIVESFAVGSSIVVNCI